MVVYEVVIPEGLTAARGRVATRGRRTLERRRFFDLRIRSRERRVIGCPKARPSRATSFRRTYRLPRGLGVREIAEVLVGQFLEVWREIEPQADRQELSMLEVVTLASIVEKETAVPHERPLIASVFRNRLMRGMRLETDPTVIYGISDFDGNLRRRDLENAENPPTTLIRIPASRPVRSRIPVLTRCAAVVNPAESDYLFFVSRQRRNARLLENLLGTRARGGSIPAQAIALDGLMQSRRNRWLLDARAARDTDYVTRVKDLKLRQSRESPSARLRQSSATSLSSVRSSSAAPAPWTTAVNGSSLRRIGSFVS